MTSWTPFDSFEIFLQNYEAKFWLELTDEIKEKFQAMFNFGIFLMYIFFGISHNLKEICDKNYKICLLNTDIY